MKPVVKKLMRVYIGTTLYWFFLQNLDLRCGPWKTSNYLQLKKYISVDTPVFKGKLADILNINLYAIERG